MTSNLENHIIDREVEIVSKSGIKYGGTCNNIDDDWVELEDDKDKKFVRVTQIESFMIKKEKIV